MLGHLGHQELLQFMILTINPNSFLALLENAEHQDLLEKREIPELQELLATLVDLGHKGRPANLAHLAIPERRENQATTAHLELMESQELVLRENLDTMAHLVFLELREPLEKTVTPVALGPQDLKETLVHPATLSHQRSLALPDHLVSTEKTELRDMV